MYEEIYDKFKGSGFELEFDGETLSDSEPIFKDAIDKLDDCKHNNDEIPIFVKCSKCDEYMDYKEGQEGELLKGDYICPKCGASIEESLAYYKMGDENIAGEKELDL